MRGVCDVWLNRCSFQLPKLLDGRFFTLVERRSSVRTNDNNNAPAIHTKPYNHPTREPHFSTDVSARKK